MPRYKLYPKDGKSSSREVEVRPSRIEIRVLPLLICFILAVTVWCYASGSALQDAESQPPVETTETSPDTDETPSDTAEPTDEGDAKPADV